MTHRRYWKWILFVALLWAIPCEAAVIYSENGTTVTQTISEKGASIVIEGFLIDADFFDAGEYTGVRLKFKSLVTVGYIRKGEMRLFPISHEVRATLIAPPHTSTYPQIGSVDIRKD